MNPFLYTTLWIYFVFYRVCNVDGGDAEHVKLKPHGRIKGGETASITEFPWTVSLHGFGTGKVLCGGSIIGSKWVLTAGHCLMKKPKEKKPVWIVVGKTEYTSANKRDRYYIKKFHPHPTYRQVVDPVHDRLESIRDDIGIIELKYEIRMSGSVLRKIPFSKADVMKDQQCQFAGWGDLDGNKQRPKELMKINVKIEQSCRRTLMHDVLVNPDDNICSQDSSHWACEGDSGGPLMCNENGRVFQKGIMSISTPCYFDKGIMAYVKVNSYVEWIQQVTKLDLYSTEDQPVGHARMNQKIANAGSAMDNGGNASDMTNLHAISAEKLDGLPRPDELNELDGSYKLEADTSQPEPRGPNVSDDSETTSGLINHDGSPMSTNSAAMPLTTSQIFMFVGVPICIIGLIGVLVVAIILNQKSSHLRKDSLAMTVHVPAPGTK